MLRLPRLDAARQLPDFGAGAIALFHGVLQLRLERGHALRLIAPCGRRRLSNRLDFLVGRGQVVLRRSGRSLGRAMPLLDLVESRCVVRLHRLDACREPLGLVAHPVPLGLGVLESFLEDGHAPVQLVPVEGRMLHFDTCVLLLPQRCRPNLLGRSRRGLGHTAALHELGNLRRVLRVQGLGASRELLHLALGLIVRGLRLLQGRLERQQARPHVVVLALEPLRLVAGLLKLLLELRRASGLDAVVGGALRWRA